MSENLRITGIKLDTTELARGRSRAEREFRRLERRANALEGEVQGASRSLRGMGRNIIAVAGALGAFQAGRFVFRTNVEFQKLEATLKTVEGSASEAERTFNLITDFAKTTPFEVQNLTSSFVQLRAFGFKPTREELKGLGNLSAAFTEDITALSGAVISAANGMTRPIRRFGVQAQVSGDQVTLSFQGVTRTVDRSAEAIGKFLAEVGNTRFADAMAERMETLDGAISNLQDTTSLLAREIGRHGLNAEIANLVQTLEEAIEEGDKFAETIGGTMAGGVRLGTKALEAWIEHQEVVILGLKILTGAAIGRGLGRLIVSLRKAAIAAGGLSAVLSANLPGTVFTLAGAIGGPLLFNLMTAKSEAEELADELDRAFDTAKEGGEEGLRSLLEQLRAQKNALVAQQSRFGQAQEAALAGAGRDSGLFKNFKARTDRVREQLSLVNTEIEAAEAALAEYEKATDDSTQSTERQNKAVSKLLERLREERDELKFTEAELIQRELAQGNATQAEVERAMALWQQIAALRAQAEAEEEAKRKVEERTKALEENMERVREQNRQIAESARQQTAAFESNLNLARMQDELDAATRAAERTTDAFLEFVETAISGSDSVSDAVRDMVARILREMARLRLSRAISGFLASLMPGGGIPDAPGPISGVEPPDVPGFQHGGSFEVGGTGGPDSQLVAFRASPGEEVHVVPPSRRGGGPGVVNHFHQQITFAPKFIDGRDGERWLRENSGTIVRVLHEATEESTGTAQALRGR